MVELVLWIQSSENGDTLRIEVRTAILNADGLLRNLSSDSRFDPYAEYADLGLNAHCSRDYLRVVSHGSPQFYRPHNVDLFTAQRMVKTLRSIQRGLVKLDDALGYAETFSQEVLRLATVLKVKTFVTHKSGPGWSLDEGQTRKINALAAQYHIDQKFAAYQKAHARTS